MRHLRLGGKIGLVIAVQIVTMLVLVLINFRQLYLLYERTQLTYDYTIPKRTYSSQIRIGVLGAIRHQANAVLSEKDKESQEFADQSNRQVGHVNERLQKLKELMEAVSTPEERSLLDEFTRNWDEFLEHHKQLMDLSVQNSNIKARQLLQDRGLDRMHVVRESLASLQQQIDRELARPEADKNTARLLQLHRRGRQLSSATGDVQELYRLLDAHNEADEAQKTVLETQLQALNKDLDGLLRDAESGLDDKDRGSFDRVNFERARVALDELREVGRKVIKLSRANSIQKASDLALGKMLGVVDKCDDTLHRLNKLYDTRTTQAREESQQAYRNALWLMGGATVGGTAFSLLLSLLLTRSITRPLARSADLAQAIARGDLSQRLQLRQGDEVGQLADAMDTVTTTLARIVADIRSVSTGIATSAGGLSHVSQQLSTMSQEMSLQASNVASASEQMSMNITTMAVAAEEMSMNVVSISSASEQMSVNISTISSAAEETSTNVGRVAHSIQEMTRSFQAVAHDAHNGSQVAGQAMEMAGNATRTMNALDKSAGEINKVTELIKTMALQTNLLALNATIEATSAGEAGKGFAVVASEIKELANQSGKAAEDIAHKIEAMQASTREAVAVIQRISTIIDEINASAGRIAGSVERQTGVANTISSNVGEASKGVGDIARSISEVSKGATDMSRNAHDAASGANDMSRNAGEAAKAGKAVAVNIQGLHKATAENAASARQVNASAQELTRIAAELQRLVGQFRVAEADDRITK